jgi:hypothetical protein
LEPALGKTIDNPSESDALFRHQLTVLTHALQATCLLRIANSPSSNKAEKAAAQFFVRRRLTTVTPTEKPSWLAFVDTVLG